MKNCSAQVDEIINNVVDSFLKRIDEISENGLCRKGRCFPTTFQMLKLANDEFYEYAYFEKTLECLVRDFLINKSFHELFRFHGIESKWPDNRNYIRYSTEKLEEIFPFEFIFVSDGKKIGVRYTSLDVDDMDELLSKYRINKILQIKWHNEVICYERKEKYEVITPVAYFERYLSIEEYKIFFHKILFAIEKANIKIGFETIPRFSLRYLSSFKATVNKVLNNTDFKQMRFCMLPESKEKIWLTDEALPESDYEVLDKNFIQRGLYKALFGKEEFARCFITAEYQFQIFKEGYYFDYTSVVCGYLKAVEQLIYKLLQVNLAYPTCDKLWIKKNNSKMPKRKYIWDVSVRENPKTKKMQVVFEQDFQEYFDIALKPMIWFLHDNINGWEISNEGRLKVHEFLINFATNCRNGYFHKDNIDRFEIVESIRNNTILIMYLLLGGYKLTGNLQTDLEEFGIEDDSFDRLYRKIQRLPKGISKFIIYFDGQEPIKAYRYFKQDQTIYDENGSVSLSKIKFIPVDVFSNSEYDCAMQGKYKTRAISLRKDNIPEKISYINGQQEERFIDW